jgi:hypothetical protein
VQHRDCTHREGHDVPDLELEAKNSEFLDQKFDAHDALTSPSMHSTTGAYLGIWD